MRGLMPRMYCLGWGSWYMMLRIQTQVVADMEVFGDLVNHDEISISEVKSRVDRI